MMKKTEEKNRIGRGWRSLAAAGLTVCCLAWVSFQTGSALAQEFFFDEEDSQAHVHTDSCYSKGNHLVCGLEETPGHQHTEECWKLVRGELLCPDNTAMHIHGDECYEWHEELTCGMEEGEGAHTHTEDCYEEETILVCTLDETGDKPEELFSDYFEDSDVQAEKEQGSTASIFEDGLPEENPENQKEDVQETPDIPEPEETMNPGDGMSSMLQMERELVFAGEPDLTADLEDEVDWWRMFCDMELSGNWAEDLIMVAESQLGYTESELNYVAEDPWHPKGYTRYGAWYGVPYGDWCAMFISFCMYYAEIPNSVIPYNCHCSEWVRELSGLGLYRNWDEGYQPKRGDFVFFDFDMDEKAEHVGIICDVDMDKGWITTIEGNRYDYVEEFVLTMKDYSIIGYCSLPENPFFDPQNPGVERQNGEVEIPPEPEEPEPPKWDNVLDASKGIKNTVITPTIEVSRVTY